MLSSDCAVIGFRGSTNCRISSAVTISLTGHLFLCQHQRVGLGLPHLSPNHSFFFAVIAAHPHGRYSIPIVPRNPVPRLDILGPVRRVLSHYYSPPGPYRTQPTHTSGRPQARSPVRHSSPLLLLGVQLVPVNDKCPVTWPHNGVGIRAQVHADELDGTVHGEVTERRTHGTITVDGERLQCVCATVSPLTSCV